MTNSPCSLNKRRQDPEKGHASTNVRLDLVGFPTCHLRPNVPIATPHMFGGSSSRATIFTQPPKVGSFVGEAAWNGFVKSAFECTQSCGTR